MGYRGYAEPGALHQLALEGGEVSCAGDRFDRLGAERTGEVAEAVLSGLSEVGVVGEDVLHGGDVAADPLDTGPGAAELGELLLQGHLREQGFDPVVTRAGRIAINIPAILAAVVLSTLPILALYVLGRRQLIGGLTAGFGK